MISSFDRNWSLLLAELILNISSHLGLLDMARLSVVCSYWRSTIRSDDSRLWPFISFGVLDRLKALFVASGSINIHMNFPSLVDVGKLRLVGTAGEWLVVVDHLDGRKPVVLHPETKMFIVLPELTTSVVKVALGAGFTTTSFIAAAMHVPQKVSVIRSGENSWTNVDIHLRHLPRVNHFEAVFQNRRLYLVPSHDDFKSVLVVDLPVGGLPVVDVLERPNAPNLSEQYQNYLVLNPSSGDLYFIYVWIGQIPSKSETYQFGQFNAFHQLLQIFRLDSSGRFWEEIHSLEDGLILLSDTGGFFVNLEENLPGLDPGRISLVYDYTSVHPGSGWRLVRYNLNTCFVEILREFFYARKPAWFISRRPLLLSV